MEKVVSLLALLALGTGFFACAGTNRTVGAGANHNHSSSSPELEYLKAVNNVAPPQDPQLLFLLMGAYANADQQAEGAEFLTARLNEFGPLPHQRAKVALPQRHRFTASTACLFRLFDPPHRLRERYHCNARSSQAALRRSDFLVNWISGVVRSQLPGFFRQKQVAQDDLTWCAANIAKAPDIGWLREVDFRLGKLALADGDQAKAQDYLRQSGYKSFDKQVTLTTPFSEDTLSGPAFAARRITEVVPGRVYALSGFEFTEYYFVVSDDRQQLIGIDAGTRTDSAKAAYEALRAYTPNLPELTTILITHSHWDHIGGQTYFRGLNPKPRFYVRSNYQEEINGEINAPQSLAKHFFGERFNLGSARWDDLQLRRA